MAKTAQNLQRKFKITDFLLGFGLCTGAPFCRYWCFTCVYWISYMYVKHSSRGTSLKFYKWRYWAIVPHPLLKPISDIKFSLARVQNFMIFRACLGPQKCNSFWRRRRNRAIPIGSLHHRCSGPKNSSSFFCELLIYWRKRKLNNSSSPLWPHENNFLMTDPALICIYNRVLLHNTFFLSYPWSQAQL